jgi:hypothetical protein
MRFAILIMLLVLVCDGSALAQVIGPPMPPDQVLRQQNAPMPPPPSVPVPAGPPPGPSMPAQVPAARGGNSGVDRASRCQHQATVERVPRSQRSAYIHSCIND